MTQKKSTMMAAKIYVQYLKRKQRYYTVSIKPMNNNGYSSLNYLQIHRNRKYHVAPANR